MDTRFDGHMMVKRAKCCPILQCFAVSGSLWLIGWKKIPGMLSIGL